MKLINAISFTGLTLISASCVTGQATEYVRGKDTAADALYDVQLGMAGMQQAAQDPVLLAQLMQDMQDPEMMAEAKKMMQSPEFKKQMKQMEKSKDFKDAVKKANNMMQDPSTAARIQAQMEHMVQRGHDSMKKNAASSMQEALEAMSNPEVMAEATKMMKDPSFQKQMSEMAKDPAFKNYVGAMQEMLQDPEQRERMESISDNFKRNL